MTETLIEIGRIRKSHGVKGEIKVHIEDIFLADFEKATFIFIGTDQRNIPYFISSNRLEAQRILKLEEVDSREAADALGKSQIFLPKDKLSFDPANIITEESDSNDFLIGYSLQDQEENVIGEIIRLDQYPQQEMLVVQMGAEEKLVPLHESLVVQFDEATKVLIMNIPEGLLEL